MKQKQSLSETNNISWHSLPIDAVFETLETTSQGLTFKESQNRRQLYGKNQLKGQRQHSIWKKFFTQCNNILIYILLVSAITTLVLGHWIDALVIFIVIVLNAIIGFIQEGKAEKSLKAIQHMLSHQATVVREDKRTTIDAKYLVPGDIVLLHAGDKVPADLRLFNVKSLQIQEAILTGESIPVTKSSESIAETKPLTDRTSMAYSGTLVTYGLGEGVVVAIGQKTEIGLISNITSHIAKIRTPLLQKIDVFGKWLTAIILIVSTITFIIGTLVWDDTITTLFLAVIGLAVAAIPEGLSTIITIAFAIGVTRMAKRNAIIRHLPAVETTGAITTICSDKTGTLTYNELAVRRIVMSEHDYHVTGSGYNDQGEFHLNHSLFPLEEHPNLAELIRAGILCNDAELTKEDNDWKLLGNPLDGAFLALGLKLKMDFDFEKKAYPITDLIPFDSRHKMMASLHHDHEGRGYIFVKGAPELILKRCINELFKNTHKSLDLKYWENAILSLAAEGHRLLAIAMKKTHTKHNELTFKDIDTDLTLLGIIGLIDPPREEAIAAVAKCQNAGIRVKMITGDHAVTACAIAKQIGIKNFAKVLTGEEIDKLDDESLASITKDMDVYARTSPEHKLRLVQALQKNGEIVAMTGDGVNDVPALKQANIGIAMGLKGSEASKEVADMVLADDNFVSIAHAIEEGRTIYDNLKKTLLFTLPTNGGEAFIIIIAIALSNLLPITAVQILWLNMATAITFAFALAFEPAEENVMKRPPRRPNEPILSGWFIWRIIFSLTLMTIAGYAIFLYEQSISTDLKAIRCAVINMLVFAEFIYLFNCRKLYTPIWRLKTILSNKAFLFSALAVAILQLCFTYLPGMEHFFGVIPIGINAWIRIFTLGIGMFILINLEKIFISGRKLQRK